MSNQFDFFMVDPGSVGDDWEGGNEAVAFRPIDSRMSNWGALNRGPRRADDYTRTTSDFAHVENEKPTVGVGFGTDRGEYDYNPYVWGSTVKKMLDDKAHKMTMGDIDPARKDVMDRKEGDATQDTPLGVTFKNYPKEGASQFRIGLKGVKPTTWAGNSWLRK